MKAVSFYQLTGETVAVSGKRTDNNKASLVGAIVSIVTIQANTYITILIL